MTAETHSFCTGGKKPSAVVADPTGASADRVSDALRHPASAKGEDVR